MAIAPVEPIVATGDATGRVCLRRWDPGALVAGPQRHHGAVCAMEFLADGKRLVIPYCHGDDLRLFRFEKMEELVPKTFGILEPADEFAKMSNRAVDPKQLDLVVAPGVAFDSVCGRLGHGRAYYDRLLRRLRPGVPVVALAFECQIFPSVPMDRHDMYLDKIITEDHIYERSASGDSESPSSCL